MCPLKWLLRQTSTLSLKPLRKSLSNFFAEIYIKDLPQVCLLPFNVHEGNQVTQAQLNFNEPLQASKDHPFILFLSVQNHCFNDQLWSLDPAQCQSHYRIAESTAAFEIFEIFGNIWHTLSMPCLSALLVLLD